jgi:hypothetical protein
MAVSNRVHRRRARCPRVHRAGQGIADAASHDAADHYYDDQLGALVSLVAEIDAWNRLNVITRWPTSDYRPGQLG